MELVVASGKGGTGKTFLASNLAYYLKHNLEHEVVCVDADAEAPDLLIAIGGEKREIWKKEVYVSRKATINYDLCVGCLRCLQVCRFEALKKKGDKVEVITERCEGCGACEIVCPTGAIGYSESKTGTIHASLSEAGIMVVTAMLEVGERNIGELVYEAKEAAYELARKCKADYVIVDSAPGIGCPVISSIAGADKLIVVIEPTPQSLNGARRLLEVARILKVEAYAVINKYDMAPKYLDALTRDLEVEIIGRVPYDYTVVEAYSMMIPVLKYSPSSKASRALLEVFKALEERVLA